MISPHVKLLAVLEDVEHGGVGRGQSRMEDAVVGVDEVVGGDGIAIGPSGIVAEVEGPLGEVFVGLPTFGDAGFVLAVVGGVVSDEAFEEGAEDIAIADAS